MEPMNKCARAEALTKLLEDISHRVICVCVAQDLGATALWLQEAMEKHRDLLTDCSTAGPASIDLLEWFPGPAGGGTGTAGRRDGSHWWWDGDLLLVQVETNLGVEMTMRRVQADGGHLSFVDPVTGDDDFGYMGDDIMRWAKLKDPNQ